MFWGIDVQKLAPDLMIGNCYDRLLPGVFLSALLQTNLCVCFHAERKEIMQIQVARVKFFLFNESHSSTSSPKTRFHQIPLWRPSYDRENQVKVDGLLHLHFLSLLINFQHSVSDDIPIEFLNEFSSSCPHPFPQLFILQELDELFCDELRTPGFEQ